MSHEVTKLKINRTIKEYDYLKSEFEYITTISDNADIEFMNTVKKYLEEKPALKDIYETKEQKIIDDNFNKIKKQSESEINDSVNDSVDEIESVVELPKKKSKKSKTLYRLIVKETHPDKVDDEKLLDLYKKATKYYSEDDAAALYAICDELNIAFGVNEEDLIFFDENIKRIKGEIDLTKGMYSYKWTQAESEEEKDNLIIDFISNKIK